MTPTLGGRLEARLFLVLVVGGLWTAAIAPFLPVAAPVADKYRAAYTVLVVVAVAGLVWELLYHLLQQFRWEKDWPTLFGLLTGVNEGVLAWLVATSGLLAATAGLSPAPFAVHFVTTWLVVWLFANGPIRLVFLRIRFRGGRIIGS